MKNSPNRKLLIISPSDMRGGAEEYALKIAFAASTQGWEVHSAFPSTSKTLLLIEELTSREIRYHRLQISDANDTIKIKAIGHFLRFMKTLFLLIRLQPDSVLIVIPFPYRAFGSILACGTLNIRTCVCFQLVPPSIITFGSLKLNLYTWARNRNQQWIAVSKYVRDFLAKSFNISNREEVAIIYNGVVVSNENELIDTEEIRRNLRKELGLHLNTRILLTVGRLNPQKGHELIIQAAKDINQEFDDIVFVWLGEGEHRNYLECKIHEYSLTQKILLLGHRNDVTRFLLAADIFVFPTYYEGLPFALAEAMANNLPLIASNAGPNPELIDDRVHGLLFTTGDSDELCKAIKWALCNGDRMQEMAINAQSRIRNFSAENMVHKTLLLLQRTTG